MVSIASLSRSAETALVFSRSSISMRICRSRAAHPRVNEPAAVAAIMAPRHRTAAATWADQFRKCFVTAELLGFVCAPIALRCRGTSSVLTGGSGKRPACGLAAFPIVMTSYLPRSESRRSSKRTLPSGSAPTGLPRKSYTSLWGWKPCCFVAASAPEAVATTKASAKVVLVNMVYLLLEFVAHTDLVCVCIMLARGRLVNQPEVLPPRAQEAAARHESACLSAAFFVWRSRKQGMLRSWE